MYPMAGRPLRRARMNPLSSYVGLTIHGMKIPFTLENLQRAAAFIYATPDIAQGVNDFCERWGEVSASPRGIVDSVSSYPDDEHDNTLHTFCVIFFAIHPDVMDKFYFKVDKYTQKYVRQFVRATLLNFYTELQEIRDWYFSFNDYQGHRADIINKIDIAVATKGRSIDFSAAQVAQTAKSNGSNLSQLERLHKKLDTAKEKYRLAIFDAYVGGQDARLPNISELARDIERIEAAIKRER